MVGVNADANPRRADRVDRRDDRLDVRGQAGLASWSRPGGARRSCAARGRQVGQRTDQRLQRVVESVGRRCDAAFDVHDHLPDSIGFQALEDPAAAAPRLCCRLQSGRCRPGRVRSNAVPTPRLGRGVGAPGAASWLSKPLAAWLKLSSSRSKPASLVRWNVCSPTPASPTRAQEDRIPMTGSLSRPVT